MADRTIVMAQNGRHGLRGVSARNPSEFEAYQDDSDNLTYTVDMASYLSGDTISSVTRVPFGLTVSNAANTTTQIKQRLKGFGYVDVKATLASGDTEQFRIHILPRVPTQTTGAQDYIEVPVATTSTSDPTTSDDSTRNFVPGNVWINAATQNVWTCISNATGAARWRHTPRVWQSGTTVNLTGAGSDAETVLAAVSIPANAMAANGFLDIDVGYAMTNSANNKLIKIRLGGVSGDQFQTLTLATGIASSRYLYTIANAGATNSQIGFVAANTVSVGSAAGANATGTQDTTTAKDLVFTGQLQTTSETLSLKWYRVTLTRPDIA